MRAHIGIQWNRFMNAARQPDLKRAVLPVPAFERAVREVSMLFREAGVRHALVGTLGANAYRNRPCTATEIEFLVGDEAFQRHPGRVVTMRVPVVAFDGIDVEPVPGTDALREGLNRAPVIDGVPIAPPDTIVIMNLLSGRTQDLADVEAIVSSGADREFLRAAVQTAAPQCADTLESLFANADRSRCPTETLRSSHARLYVTAQVSN